MKTDNVLIATLAFSEPVKSKDFKFEDYFQDYHYQDCCEKVYADWDTANKNLPTLISMMEDIRRIEIKGTPDMGITLFFYPEERDFGDGGRYGIFVPCYNAQNGYYSNELELIIKSGAYDVTFDVSDFVKDDID